MQEIEAKVTAKGQVTLPKALRSYLGIEKGSRIRFRLHPNGGFQADRVLFDLEDHWKMADQMAMKGAGAKGVMTFEKMNEAKARRVW
ncbi:MAG: AbrB/MazE/SpoVT family DNA-binding domain-containing protein [Terracidiphilus sp.]